MTDSKPEYKPTPLVSFATSTYGEKARIKRLLTTSSMPFRQKIRNLTLKTGFLNFCGGKNLTFKPMRLYERGLNSEALR